MRHPEKYVRVADADDGPEVELERRIHIPMSDIIRWAAAEYAVDIPASGLQAGMDSWDYGTSATGVLLRWHERKPIAKAVK